MSSILHTTVTWSIDFTGTLRGQCICNLISHLLYFHVWDYVQNCPFLLRSILTNHGLNKLIPTIIVSINHLFFFSFFLGIFLGISVGNSAPIFLLLVVLWVYD